MLNAMFYSIKLSPPLLPLRDTQLVCLQTTSFTKVQHLQPFKRDRISSTKATILRCPKSTCWSPSFYTSCLALVGSEPSSTVIITKAQWTFSILELLDLCTPSTFVLSLNLSLPSPTYSTLSRFCENQHDKTSNLILTDYFVLAWAKQYYAYLCINSHSHI